MEKANMGGILLLGDTQVDQTSMADLCRQYQVRELSLFGSAARGDMRPDSDIDLLVDFLPGSDIDLVDYTGFMLDLSRLIGRKVDLVSKNGLKPLIRASVLEEARLLYFDPSSVVLPGGDDSPFRMRHSSRSDPIQPLVHVSRPAPDRRSHALQ